MRVRIDQLEMYNDPGLIFAANTSERKGLAIKSYTLTIPRTIKNNAMLNNIWGSGVLRPSKFEAEFNIRGIRLCGLLLVDRIETNFLMASFVGGNGMLWDRLGQASLRHLDMSDLNVTLNKNNVMASESGLPVLLFDLTDRGEFASSNAIDISDRFPAIQIKELLRRIVNYAGAGVQFDEWRTSLSDKYLLYTGDGKPRGTDEWLQEAATTAELTYTTDNRFGYGNETNAVWTYKLPLEPKSNPGYYFDNNRYVALKGGTYRIKAEIGELSVTFAESPPSTPPAISYNGQANKINISIELWRNGQPLAIRSQTVDLVSNSYTSGKLTVDTFPIELQQNDYVELYVVIRYSSQLHPGTTSNYVMTLKQSVLNAVGSRWYGAGSTVVVNDLLPDVTMLEFLKIVSEALGLDFYFNEMTNQLLIRSGKDRRPLATYKSLTYKIETARPMDVVVEQESDKSQPLPNRTIKISNSDGVKSYRIRLARTLVAKCPRLIMAGTAKIPILWNSGNPMDATQWYNPPKRETSANMRIVKLAEPVAGSYTLTYGGNPNDYQATITSVLQLVDVNFAELLLQDLTMTNDRWVADVNVDEALLVDLTMFKRPINVEPLGLAMLLEAEQLRGSWYRLTLQPLINYEIVNIV